MPKISKTWKMCIRDRGDSDGIKALEKELLAQNAEHKDWCCTEELMKTTKDGKALYLHCLPADINDVSLSLIHILFNPGRILHDGSPCLVHAVPV